MRTVPHIFEKIAMLHPQRRYTRLHILKPTTSALDDESGACLSRKSFEERLHHALTKANGSRKKLSVMVIDLDHFSERNGLLGHKGGDALLRIAAIKIGARLSECKTFARIGNDEFAVPIPGEKIWWERTSRYSRYRSRFFVPHSFCPIYPSSRVKIISNVVFRRN
jgi:GGDEF domain-containing protein